MSRKLCCQGAHAYKGLNLLLVRGVRPDPRTTVPSEIYDWEQNELLRRERARTETQRQQMHRKYLQRCPSLANSRRTGTSACWSGVRIITQACTYSQRVRKLCFQQEVVRLVFATETLVAGPICLLAQ